MKTLLTLLTEPVYPVAVKGIKHQLKKLLRPIRNYILPTSISPIDIPQPLYGGHYAVTRSLIEGLKELGINYTYNPKRPDEIHQTVIVLSDPNALKQAIELKRSGKITRLLAGPNIVVFSTDYNGILGSEEIDTVIVPCDWVRIAYEEDVPSLKGKIQIWPAGVDTNFWKAIPDISSNRKVVVYWKTEPEDFCNRVEAVLREFNWQPVRVKYGAYTSEEFKARLADSCFAIFISRSESQGIALAEAWAMDISTLVWLPSELTIRGRHFSSFSTAPYLNDCTGKFWKDLKDLENLLLTMESQLLNFKPREWIMQHMTDVIAAKKLLNIASANGR